LISKCEQNIGYVGIKMCTNVLDTRCCTLDM